MTLFSGFDITPFLSRPSVPYTPPKAVDYSALMGSLDSIAQMMQHQRDAADKDAAEQRQFGLQQSAQDETKRYHDIENSRYQATDARLQKSETDKHVAEIQQRLIDARSRGDKGTEEALLNELGRVTGWNMTEHASNYQPPEAQAQAAAGAAPPLGGPTDFDAAYQSMVQKESGNNHRAVHPSSGALGTFQLMPDQLPKGMTKEQFLAMTPEQQRQVYETHYLPAHGLSRDTLAPQDVGLSVGAPAAISMPDEAVVYPKGSKAVAQNPSWDRNKDGQITAAELRANYGAPPSSLARPPEPEAPQGPAPFLKDFMGQQAPGQEQAPTGSMPWEMLGLGNPPAQGAGRPEEAVPGGGRYVFRDASGKVQYEYDRTKVLADQQGAVKNGLQPLLDNATTDEEKKAARQAIGFASAAVGNGLNPKEAYTQGMTLYEKAMSETGKTARAGVSSSWGQLKQLQLDSDKVHGDTMKQFAIPKLNEAEHDLDDGIAAVNAHNGLGDTAALAHFAQSMTHRLTDFEFRNFADSSGIVNSLMNTLNRVLTGERTPEVMAQLKQQLEMGRQSIAAVRQKAADTAGQAILQGSQYPLISDDMRMQYANRAMQRIIGSTTAPVGGAPNAAGYGDKSLDDLAKELGQ